MERKIRILNIISSLDPKYGGLTSCLIHWAIQLRKDNFEVAIVTSDNKSTNYIKIKGVKIINLGSKIGLSILDWIGRYSLNLRLLNFLFKNRDKFDVFIVHGIWQFNTLVARIMLKKNYYVFTQGMLDKYFLKENFLKVLKKKIYWFCVEKKNLLNAKAILLSSKKQGNMNELGFANTHGIKKKVVRFGMVNSKYNKKKCLNLFYKKYPSLKNKVFYLFLGRYHQKKGLEILIKAAHLLKKQNLNINIVCFGPKNNNDYEEKLLNLIDKFKLKNQILMFDAIYNQEKTGAMLACTASLLPTLGENFGIALVESLILSKPVITTTKTNIFKEIEKSKAGLISLPNAEQFSKNLKKFHLLSKISKMQMNKNAFKCFKENFDISVKKNSLSELIINDFKKNIHN